ncbi:MAG: DUF4384 domain-containing protein, partial [Planctomycetaceae bacterium]|nr:DUF4384 domain-containing protein [Planctomycetaceae bacterium]
DVEAGDEVWNYPIYAYKIEYEPVSENSGMYQAKLGLWMADDAVAPDFVGVKVRYQTYQFTFQMKNEPILMGSGKWTGSSLKDHPDFAWYPYVARAENPEIDYQLVQTLLGRRRQAVPSTDGATESPSEPELVANNGYTESNPPAEPVESGSDNVTAENLTSTQSRDILSPLELTSLVTNRTSAFNFDVSIDRFEGGIYRVGERFTISAKSELPGYLYLLQINPEGKLNLIYPLSGQDNRIPGGKLVQIPSKGNAPKFQVQGPPGQYRVTAVVTSRQLFFSGLITQAGLSQPQIQNLHEQNQNQTNQQKLQRIPNEEPGLMIGETGQFRWHPTQRRLIEHLLREYLQNEKSISDSSVSDVKKILGKFAQDEVLFLVQ